MTEVYRYFGLAGENHNHDTRYPAGDPAAPTDGNVWAFDAASGGWIPKAANAHSHADYAPIAGYITGANYRWDSGTGYSIEPGEALVDGQMLSWASDLSRSALALTANTLYYVYLSAGPALEESTTAPAWDSQQQYYRMGTDATRRCVSYLVTDGGGAILRFLSVSNGRAREMYDIAGRAARNILVNGGSISGSWSSFALGLTVPAHASHWYAAPKLEFSASGDDGMLGISPVDLGSLAGSLAPYSVRSQGTAAGSRIFFGRSWQPVRDNINYYRLQVISGSPTATIESFGARFVV